MAGKEMVPLATSIPFANGKLVEKGSFSASHETVYSVLQLRKPLLQSINSSGDLLQSSN